MEALLQARAQGSIDFFNSGGDVGTLTGTRLRKPTVDGTADAMAAGTSTDKKHRASSIFWGGGDKTSKTSTDADWVMRVDAVDPAEEANELGRAYKNWVENHFTMHPECVIPVPSPRDPKICTCGREIGLVSHCPPPASSAVGAAAAAEGGDPRLREWKLDTNVALAPTTSYVSTLFFPFFFLFLSILSSFYLSSSSHRSSTCEYVRACSWRV